MYLTHKDIVFTREQRQIIKEWSILRVNLLDFTSYFRRYFLIDVSSWDLLSAKCKFDFEDKQRRLQSRPTITRSLLSAQNHQQTLPTTSLLISPSDYVDEQAKISQSVRPKDNTPAHSDTSGDTEIAPDDDATDNDVTNDDDETVGAVFGLWADQAYLNVSSSPINGDNLKQARLKRPEQLAFRDYRRAIVAHRSSQQNTFKTKKTKQARQYLDDDDDAKVAQWHKVHGKWVRR